MSCKCVQREFSEKNRFIFLFNQPSLKTILKIIFIFYTVRLNVKTKNNYKIFYILGGIIINIECKAWAHNIRHDRHDRIGSVHFELMID